MLSGMNKNVSVAWFLGWMASGASQLCAQTPAAPPKPLVQRYCFACHNNQVKTADVSLAGLDVTAPVGDKAELLERVLRKVKNGQMPPAGAPRPNAAQATAFVQTLEQSLDAAAAADPNPGHPAPHRLNRAEYSNAIRDIFDLDVKAGGLLPVDDSGYGFDNIGDVLSVSSTLLDQYISVGRKMARLIVGDVTLKPAADVFEPRRDTGRSSPVAPRLEWVSDDLPFNSAGGVAVKYYFPLDAEYVLRVNFGNGNAASTDKPFELRLTVPAGLRSVGVTFPRESLRAETLGFQMGGGAPRGAPGERVPTAVDLRLDGMSVKKVDGAGAAVWSAADRQPYDQGAFCADGSRRHA